MSAPDLKMKAEHRDQELKIQRQIAFASGLFQGDVTVRTLLESLAEGVVIIDNSGTILLVNTRAEQMFDYPRQELIGKPHSVLIPERFRKIHEEHEAKFFAEPRIRPMGQLLDLAGLRRDGSEFPLEISLSFVETINGVLALAFVSDITKRKRAEMEIKQLNSDLEARAVELEAANKELEAFNYTVAHDLRQPLNVINSYYQVIQELCGVKLDEACKSYLREAYDGTLRMNRLIDALLMLSRMSHVEMHPEKFDISTIAQTVAAELQLTALERRVMFRISEGMSVDGDSTLLRVVLENLLGNAWKFTGAREEAVIEFGVTVIDGVQTYYVRDNGAGFDMANAEKLFAAFHRLPVADEIKGFGIGLATVERIIRRHGGRVWAEGEPGNGATFYFTLSAVRVST
jgi:PAS domain S-box-containing protein